MFAGKRDLQFEKVISDVTADMKLTRDDDFTLRVVQLSELLAIRHCVFLMGPTGSGRSEVYKVRAHTVDGAPCQQHRVQMTAGAAARVCLGVRIDQPSRGCTYLAHLCDRRALH